MSSLDKSLRGDGFTPNHKEFGLHIRSEEARAPSLVLASLIQREANISAPFAEKKKGDRRRRHLKGSYKTARRFITLGGQSAGSKRSSRAGMIVYSDLLEAATKEFGTKKQRPVRPLGNAARFVAAREIPGDYDFRGPRGR